MPNSGLILMRFHPAASIEGSREHAIRKQYHSSVARCGQHSKNRGVIYRSTLVPCFGVCVPFICHAFVFGGHQSKPTARVHLAK